MKFNKDAILDFFFIGLLFIIYINLNGVTSMLFGVSQLASPLILICCGGILYRLKVSKISFASISVKLLYSIFILYYLIGTISRLFHIEVGYRVGIVDMYMKGITSAIVILAVHQYMYYKLVQQRNERAVFNALYIPIVLSCAYAVYQSLNGISSILGDEDSRIMGFFANPNSLGLVANMSIILTVYSFYKHSNYKIIKLIILFMSLFVSFISLSKASIITSIVVLLFALLFLMLRFFSLSGSDKLKHVSILSLFVVLSGSLVLNFNPLVEKYASYGQAKRINTIVELVIKGKVNAKNTSGRKEVFEYGLERIKERPLFGNGIAYFMRFPAEYGFDHGVHNTYLLIFGDAGIFAFLTYIFFIFSIWIKSLLARPLPALLASGLIVVWALQNLGSHNGLDDKLSNILIMFATMYLIYGISKPTQVNVKELDV